MIRNTVRNSVNSSVKGTQRVFDPLDLSPLVWFDASDKGTITLSGSDVTLWDDKSGNGYDVSQGTGSLQPVYLAGQGVYFALDYLEATGSNLSSKNLSVFAVISMGAAPTTYEYVTGTSGSTGGDSFCFGVPNSGDWRAGQPNGGDHSRADFAYATHFQQDEVFTISSHLNSSGGSIIRKNNTDLTMIATDFSQITTDYNYLVGSGYSDSSGFNFTDVTIKEILYFEELTENQIGGVEIYLSNKWGIY